MITVIFYNVDGRECKTQFVDINPNENIYIHNGVYANGEIFDKVAAEEPEAVIMVGYLRNDKKICVVVTPSEVYVTGKVILREEKEEGYLRILKFQSDKIKEIEYYLNKDKRSISMISVIFDREYDKEEYTIRN